MQAVGAVAGLVTQGGEEVGLVSVSAAVPMPTPVLVGAGGCWVEGAGGSWKRVREKNTSSGFYQVWVALKLVHHGGRGLRAMFRERIQVLGGGGIWNLTGFGLGNRTTANCTDRS